MSDTAPTHVDPEPDYLEPLPQWLLEELAAGRDKLPEYRAALIRAQASCTGQLVHTQQNQEQHYMYSGHADVMAHVRAAMLQNGITVEQVTCDLEARVPYRTFKGAAEAWKWRVVCLITHTSGAAVVRVVRAMTTPGNKASFVASTAADRTLLMRLMRLAGEDPEPQREVVTPDRGGNRGGGGRRDRREGGGSGGGGAGGGGGGGGGGGADQHAAELREWLARRVARLDQLERDVAGVEGVEGARE